MLYISYLYRIHIATFLPFRAYNTDNQLIIRLKIEDNYESEGGCKGIIHL